MLSRRLRLTLIFLTSIEFIGQSFFTPLGFVTAQGAKETPECSAALQAAQKKIKDGRDVTIALFEKGSVVSDEAYESYPKGRPSKYEFGLDGPAAESIIHSSKFLNAISTDIIKKCRSVSIVNFGFYMSDVSITFGLVGSNVKEFTQCGKYSGTEGTDRIPWGTILCF